MKRTLVTVLGSAALLVAVSPTAKADAFLSLQNGLITKSCNTSMAINVGTNCLIVDGFIGVVLGDSEINFSGSVGGYSVTAFKLANSQGAAFSQATTGQTEVANIAALATALTVSYAINNFALPAGSPLTLSASQSAVYASATVGSSQTFTGWGNALNTLAVVTGPPFSTTAVCSAPATAPPAQACATVGPAVLFPRVGNFALNGQQVINLNQGGSASYQSQIVVMPPNVVLELGSVVLLATGLFGLVGGRRFFRRNA